MLKDLLQELKKACFSIIPIFLLISILCLLKIINLSTYEYITFLLSTLFIIIGIALFSLGAEKSMMLLGRKIGKGLTKQGKTYILIIVIFVFGFLVTFSEPDLSVLAEQTKSLFNSYLLITLISIAVGLFLLIATLKIIKKINLIRILSLLYMIAFGLTILLIYKGKLDLLALCFDSGGVTTGPITVPFIMALGVGISSILSLKSEKDASFGFIAFSSIGPIIVMLLLCLLSKNSINFVAPDYSLSDNFINDLFVLLLDKLYKVGLAIGSLFLFYLIVDIIFFKSNKNKILDLLKGVLITYLGLVIFLVFVEACYIGIGYKIGTDLAGSSNLIICIVGFVIGALTVLAEPVIQILTIQVEEITNGIIKKRSMLIALTIGVGLAISLSLLRVIYEISIVYIIVIGYTVCFILSFFIPKIYTAIAFDAGGVVSGPLTSSFILPLVIGVCSVLNGNSSILLYGFGVVSLVALSPLISLELLGLVASVKDNIKTKNEIKRVLKDDDKILIKFGGSYEKK